MTRKKVLQVTLASICVAATAAGVGLMKATKVSAETATAEWATGNSAVTATFNYDLASSTFKRYDGNTWRINTVDNTAIVANNEAYAEKGFWTEESYTGLNPLVYSTEAVGSEANGSSIALGYYDDDFKIACAPIQSGPSSWRSVDYMALQWKFTDIATGNYFNVCTHTFNTDNGILNIRYNAVTTKSNTWLNQASANIGVTFKGVSGKYLVNLWFDGSSKTLYFGQDLSQSVNVEEFLTREKTGTTIDTPAADFPEFEAYTVELSFDGFNWEPTYQPGKDAEHPTVPGNLAVYYLNGMETHSTTINDLTSPGATIFQKTSEVILEDTQTVNLADIGWAWDPVKGDVTNSIVATVKGPDGQDVAVANNGAFEAVKTGDYTITATISGKSKTCVVHITSPTPATTEWATGNSAVTATFNYDFANSDYSTWAINSIDNTAIVANNEAFAAKGFWTEESYTGLKPLVYSTTAVGSAANNSTIALGYYDDDFKIACTPMLSYARGEKTSYVRADYMALQWKFTDIATGNYFSVLAHTWNTTTGIMNILYNKTISASGDVWQGKVSSDIGVNFMGKNGNNLLNLWFDGSSKTLYFGNDLSQSVNVEEFVEAANFPEFEAYTVELSFKGFNWNTTYQTGDRTGNLAVYYLNGETHSTTKYTLNSTKATMYAAKDSVTTTDGVVDTNGIVKAWDRVVGDVSSEVSYTVTAPDSSAVAVTDGKFVATTSGAYTLNASVTVNDVTTTKAVTLNVAFPTGGVILKKASLNLEGKIGVQFLVSADTALYNAEGGKVVFTVAGETTEVAFADWTAYGTDYIVECKVAAKQMADTISVKFVDKNGAETATTTYSVKEYANQVLTQYADNEELVSLIKATLNYGAYAQTYFNYNVENLANAGLFEGETNPVDALTEVTAATASVSNPLTEVSLKSLSLGLETETEIYALFTLASGVSIDDVTIKLGDVTLETVEAGGNYYVVIENVAAKNIDEVYTLTVTYGDNTATYSISAQCYISAAFTEVQTAYNDLLKAIQLYNVAANAYFA